MKFIKATSLSNIWLIDDRYLAQ